MERKNLDDIADNLITVFALFHKHIMHLDDRGPDFGLSRSHIELLFVLDDLGSLPMSKIGELLYISKPYVTALVDKLDAQGMVKRLPGKNDRRVTNITLTNEGRTYLKEHKKLLRRNIKSRLTTLSDDDRVELSTSLTTMWRILPTINIQPNSIKQE